MAELAAELTRLALADRHLAEGEERILHQVELVERLRADGQGTQGAVSTTGVTSGLRVR